MNNPSFSRRARRTRRGPRFADETKDEPRAMLDDLEWADAVAFGSPTPVAERPRTAGRAHASSATQARSLSYTSRLASSAMCPVPYAMNV